MGNKQEDQIIIREQHCNWTGIAKTWWEDREEEEAVVYFGSDICAVTHLQRELDIQMLYEW